MTTANQTTPRSRVPNGAAKNRIAVALPEDVLEKVRHEAELTRRTSSSLVSLIVTDYFSAKKEA